MPPQPLRRLDPTPSDPRPDPTPPQPGAVARAVIALVSVQLAGSGPPPAGWGQHRRDIVQDRGEHGHVGDVGRRHDRGQRQPAPLAGEVDLGPRLAAIDRICANVVPRVWRARWPSPRSRVTSPAGPPDQAGPAPPDGAARTPRPWPTRSTGAMPSPASHSQVPDWQEPPRGRGAGHVDDRGETATIRNRSPSAAIPRARCGRQQGCDHLPELVGNQVLSKGRHDQKLRQSRPRERNDALAVEIVSLA